MISRDSMSRSESHNSLPVQSVHDISTRETFRFASTQGTDLGAGPAYSQAVVLTCQQAPMRGVGRGPDRRKECRCCHVVKSLRQFYANKRNVDGRENSCKDCKREAVRENAELKREVLAARRRQYQQSPAGKAVRARYLANGGRDRYNANRRLNTRIRAMERVAQGQVALEDMARRFVRRRDTEVRA